MPPGPLYHGVPTARGSRLRHLLGLAAETLPRPQNVDPPLGLLAPCFYSAFHLGKV